MLFIPDGKGPFKWTQLYQKLKQPFRPQFMIGRESHGTGKNVSHHVKYYIVLKNLKVYSYQGLDTGMKVCHLLQSIKCNKMSSAITAVMANPDRCVKKIDACVIYLCQYVEMHRPIQVSRLHLLHSPSLPSGITQKPMALSTERWSFESIGGIHIYPYL